MTKTLFLQILDPTAFIKQNLRRQYASFIIPFFTYNGFSANNKKTTIVPIGLHQHIKRDTNAVRTKLIQFKYIFIMFSSITHTPTYFCWV